MPHLHELPHLPNIAFPPREYFILTNAGKPVFTSRTHVEDSSDDLTSAMGLMQALISVFADDGDKIRCINAGRTRISFLLRSPLYYVCVSSWREPESVIRVHLDYLHQQILSVVTASQLRKIFERRNNFDLRRLLDGTDGILHLLLSRLEQDVGLTTGSLGAVRLDHSVRSKAGDLLVPPKDLRDVLYVLLLLAPCLVKQSIHPSDLHVLLNTLSAPSLSSNSAPSSSSWLPICLPKYNSDGFLHVYVTFFGGKSEAIVDPSAALPPTPISGSDGSSSNTSLRSTGLLNALITASGRHGYSTNDLGVPGLRHFLYKSRSHVQITMPVWEEPYEIPDERKRLITLYQCVHDALHARSGQAQGPLKLHFLRTEKEIVMGWVTQPFELIVTLLPHLPKSAVVGAANAVAKWVKKEEGRLFIRDAPVF
ncbi:hypothetical protein BS47DRAFT_1370687 [Hydnum rufescens UP504]|uniref:Vacuolar fusion protein MON1 n=1 Tax=Hydnum rufescens UP504 TaxID=1448309 RepID=A0A9P6B8I0_9AGAM|nr:hypothetical protein BS47DRAFT_1370687 [Hydnum rufescens UP504]